MEWESFEPPPQPLPTGEGLWGKSLGDLERGELCIDLVVVEHSSLEASAAVDGSRTAAALGGALEVGTLNADALAIDRLDGVDGDGDALDATVAAVPLDAGDFTFSDGTVTDNDHAVDGDVAPETQLNYVANFGVGGFELLAEGEAEGGASLEGDDGDWWCLVGEGCGREEGEEEEERKELHGIGFIE